MEKENTTVAATLANPQFKAGRKLIDAGRLEEAVEYFSGLLETRVGLLNDEMSPALAPLYYEYGNALLYHTEESGAVFGDAITDAEKKRAMAMLEQQAAQNALQQDEANGGSREGKGAVVEGSGADGDGPVTGDQETEDDLEIAWENLEMARRIYEKLEVTEEIRTLLGKVHLRLGDLNMVNGMYNEAAEEFGKCLTHRTALHDPVSRGVADAHVRRAQAHFYASTLKGADKDGLVASSLEQYRSAARIFEAMLAALKTEASKDQSPGKENKGKQTSPAPPATTTITATAAENRAEPAAANGKGKGKENPGAPPCPSSLPNGSGTADANASAAADMIPGSAEDLQDVLDTIRETIETMVSGQDMEALAEYKSGAVSTTTGFGNPSSDITAGSDIGSGSSGGASGEVATIGFGGAGAGVVEKPTANGGLVQTGFGVASASGTAAAGAGAGATVMVVKRKGRPTPKVAPSGGAAAAAATIVGEGEGEAKRAKNET